jgi:polyhydroxyalkanoate synthase
MSKTRASKPKALSGNRAKPPPKKKRAMPLRSKPAVRAARPAEQSPKPPAVVEPASTPAPQPILQPQPQTTTDFLNMLQGMFRNPDVLARNLAQVMEQLQHVAAAYVTPRQGHQQPVESAMLSEAVRSLSAVGQYWLSDPERSAEAQKRLWNGYLQLWTGSFRRMMGEKSAPAIQPDPGDKRFADPEYENNPFYDFVKQAYLLASRWADGLVHDAVIDEPMRHKAEFYLRQIVAALAPSNFVFTNPELLRTTVASNAENLVKGLKMMAEDIEAGKGGLRIRQTAPAFKLGVDLATTPGKVIWRDDICEIIQYTPTTKTVLKRPLLIVPPWINKFYILDLTAEKSFIRWCVEQGHTVFVISWVNPDARQSGKGFDAYLREGILAAMNVVAKATGEKEINAVGYCVGGTLLAATLAYLGSKDARRARTDPKIVSATLFATQVDFTYAGDLKVFLDEAQVAEIEKRMGEAGYLEGSSMAETFNMLRPNDLIWPYFVRSYLMGKEPSAFDLLYWNADATRMPAANHSFYLRNCYLNNRLARGEIVIDGVRLDLDNVTVPVFALATRDDHIAPALSVLTGSRLFGGKVEFVLGGSGHIAGVINPPSRNKYAFWTGGASNAADMEAWMKSATEHPGSWWPYWQKWIEAGDKRRVKARKPGGGKLQPIEDAPGSYVMVRA